MLLEGDDKEKERYFGLKYSIPKDIKIDENDMDLYYQISHIANSERPADEIKKIAKLMLIGTKLEGDKNKNDKQNNYYLNKKSISEYREKEKSKSIDNTSKAHNASAENLRNIMITQDDDDVKHDNYTKQQGDKDFGKLQQDKSYNFVLSPQNNRKTESLTTNRTEDAITADSILAVVNHEYSLEGIFKVHNGLAQIQKKINETESKYVKFYKDAQNSAWKYSFLTKLPTGINIIKDDFTICSASKSIEVYALNEPNALLGVQKSETIILENKRAINKLIEEIEKQKKSKKLGGISPEDIAKRSANNYLESFGEDSKKNCNNFFLISLM